MFAALFYNRKYPSGNAYYVQTEMLGNDKISKQRSFNIKVKSKTCLTLKCCLLELKLNTKKGVSRM